VRPDRLVVWTQEPLNAETPLDLLGRREVTPTELFFVRNHGPIPTVDLDSYRLSLGGALGTPLRLSLGELRERYPGATVTATLACAGNRRSELERVAPIPDAIPWGAGAIGNAVWSGVRLRDLLLAAGVAPAARHVAFTGLDGVDADGRREAFGGSIPLARALEPDVLLAFEMNGEALPPEHGFPVRAVVPGYIGARSVKWLTSISVQPTPSESHFQTRDYALDGSPLGELPLNSAVCATGQGPTVVAEGYAVAGGSRRVERVEVSADGGQTWLPAALRGEDRPGAWRLWRAELELRPGPVELAVRAWDSAGATQPESAATIWNPRGYMNNAWHRARVEARRS
jgi:sulfite oxidase